MTSERVARTNLTETEAIALPVDDAVEILKKAVEAMTQGATLRNLLGDLDL